MTSNHIRQPGRSMFAVRGVFVALRSPLRWLAAAALLVAGAVHVPITEQHLREAPYIGVLFIALTAACGVLALLVVLWDAVAVWAAAGLVSALAVIGYVLSRSVGLPEITDDIGKWADPLGVAAMVTEGLTVLIALGVLALHLARSQAGREPDTA